MSVCLRFLADALASKSVRSNEIVWIVLPMPICAKSAFVSVDGRLAHLVGENAAFPRAGLLLDHPIETLELEWQELERKAVGLHGALGLQSESAASDEGRSSAP